MDKEEQFNNATVAVTLAKDIRIVAEKARNEEELRIGVEKLLEPALKKLGIAANPRYEKRISRTILTAVGRADALYGQAIIEYEPPGKLSTAKGKNSTKKQIEGYLLGLAGSGKQREDTLRRIAGIAIDGQSIFFVRYRADKPLPQETIPKEQLTQFPLFEEDAPQGSFVEIGPYQITEESINEFLMYLRALRRRRLSADELAREFGPAGEMAHKVVNSLYNRLTDCLTTPGSSFPRVEMLYEEWKRIFGIVYGQELVKAESDARALARLYHITEFTDLKPLLFAVHTYYALFMKLLAAELLSLQQGALLASIAEQLPALSGELLQSRVEELEKGTWFESQGIRNFLEADFFGWYLSVWNIDIEQSIRSLARALAEYEPATATLAPEATRDLLKKLYQDLVPQELRHDLGEYYTPDWLAELLLKEVGYTGNPDHRLLDPACGSGTFLVLVIRCILDYAQDSLAWRARGERELVSQILENVVGFDLNPLAVITARPKALSALEKVIGKSDYQAHAGACTWANGIYWLRILERRPEGLLVVENLNDVGKKKVKQVQMVIEPDLVYPLLRGRDVGRWQAKPSACILMVQNPQKRVGYDESWLKVQYPLTYAYLKEFEDMLRERSGYRKYFDPQKDPFYTMYDVSDYTFQPYKVMWRQMIETLDAVVTEPIFDTYVGQKVPVTQHVVTIVSFRQRDEAHYFCALINTSVASLISASYSTSKSFGTPTVVEFVSIPKYNSQASLHQSLVLLSQRAHQLAALGESSKKELYQVEEEIDRKAAELWGLSEEELKDIQVSLKEIS